MLVDDYSVIKEIMKFSPVPLVVHSEDENIIKEILKIIRKGLVMLFQLSFILK